MRDSKSPEFDRYAQEYTALHHASIGASGEEPSYFAAYKAEYLASRVPSAHDGHLSVLDFGCGVGNSIPHLRRALPNANLFGADPSSESILMANSALSSAAEFHTIEGPELPFASSSFDVVLVACVLHHVAPKERLHWMRELHRVMKRNASIFVFEHNMLNPLTIKVVRDCPFDEHAILLPRSELVELARNGGFSAIRTRYIVFFPRAFALLRPLEPIMGWIPFGAQYVLQAKA